MVKMAKQKKLIPKSAFKTILTQARAFLKELEGSLSLTNIGVISEAIIEAQKEISKSLELFEVSKFCIYWCSSN